MMRQRNFHFPFLFLIFSVPVILSSCADAKFIGDESKDCITTFVMNAEFCKSRIRDAGIKFDACIDDCDNALRLSIANAMGVTVPQERLAGINAALQTHLECKETCSTAFRGQLYEQGIVCHENATIILETCTGNTFSAVDSLQQKK